MTDPRLETLRALSAAYNGEALFRPSSIDRTIHCPGSVRLIARAPRDRRMTPWIVEGLAAHKVSEDALKGIRQPDEWSDRMVRVDDEGINGAFVDEEMVDAVGLYLEVVETDMALDVERLVEVKLNLQPLDPSDPVLGENRGTADCVQIDLARRRIRNYDLKYGKGVMVSAETPQVRNYALMGLVSFAPPPGGWEEIENIIVQPRAADPRQRVKRISFHPNDLLTGGFLSTLTEAMDAALEPDPPLTSGAWCRWCPAKTICPAYRDQAINLARDTFDPGPSFRAGDMLGPLPTEVWVGTVEEPRPATNVYGRVVLPAPTDLDPGEIATILARAPLFEAWIEAVQHRAVSLLDTGTHIPGWKLAQRSGHRRWKDADAAPDALRALGMQTSAMYTEPKLRSPAQVEKLLPVAKRDSIATLVERPLGAVVLVPAESAKPAVPPALGPIA